MWGVRRCAAELGVSPTTWSTYASRGLTPPRVARGQWDAAEVHAWAHPHIATDPTIPTGIYGARDGHARYGILDQTEDGRLICHECGRGVWHLATHIAASHHLQVDDYRRAHGLPLTLPLVARPVRERLEEAWQDHAAEHERTLREHRDPALATQASRGIRRTGAPRPRGTRGRSLTSGEVQALAGAATTLEWVRMARRLMDDGVSGVTISRATGIKHGTVSARLSRLAPRQ